LSEVYKERFVFIRLFYRSAENNILYIYKGERRMETKILSQHYRLKYRRI